MGSLTGQHARWQGMTMRLFGLVLSAGLLAASAHAQNANGIPPDLSRCAGKVGTEIRQADPAFVTVALNGRPWMTIERTDEAVGSQRISTTVTGIGWRRRRDGTAVSFRFTCLLDAQGQAMMFHATTLLHGLGDQLPPSIIVEGAASYLEKMPLPRGVELQVQLLDVSKLPAGEVLAEQVVRSGWQVPIPFALLLPKQTPLEGRKLVITARFVLDRRPLFQLQEQRVLTAADLRKFIVLSLDRVGDVPR